MVACHHGSPCAILGVNELTAEHDAALVGVPFGPPAPAG